MTFNFCWHARPGPQARTNVGFLLPTTQNGRDLQQLNPRRAGTSCTQDTSLGELDCSHFNICSGCSVDRNLATPSVLARAQQFFRSIGYNEDITLHVGSYHGWRHRARLAVRSGPDGTLTMGLFKAGTHEVVSIPTCRAHHPAINSAALLVLKYAKECKIKGYDEATGAGDLRYVQLALAEPTQKTASSGAAPELYDEPQHLKDRYTVQIVLVWNSVGREAPLLLRRFASSLWNASSGFIHSVHVNFNVRRDNAIMGPLNVGLYGDSIAWESLLNNTLPVAYNAQSFMQANPCMMSAALSALREWVPRGCRFVDLHAGVGTIALSMAETQELTAVRLVEINPLAERPFWTSWQERKSRRKFSEETVEEEVEYHVAAAGSDPERWLSTMDVAVVDPPRKGLESSLLYYLCSSNIPNTAGLTRLAYLSCGWEGFERDCTALVASRQWRLQWAQPFLFFPGTNHIETLAIFDRT